jgi:hypothetical protein
MSVRFWLRTALTVLVVSSSWTIVGCGGDTPAPTTPASTPTTPTPPKDATPPK